MKKYVITSLVLISLAVLSCYCFANNKTKRGSEINDLVNVFTIIQNNYVEEIDPEVLLEGAIKGMLEQLEDPYSVYLDKAAWRDITDTTRGNFGGVGLSITKSIESTPEKPAYVEVVEPIENSPGAKAGIRAGDKIIKIEDVDTSTIDMDTVLKMLRGEKGTDVKITVRRRNSNDFEVVLTRDIIENQTVKYGYLESKNIKIPYIKISSFASSTAKNVKEALKHFSDESSLNHLIIDLRNNGGGLLDSALEIADIFMDSGVIVSTRSRVEKRNDSYEAKEDIIEGFPIVVLVNEASASASEILAGALKDSKKAYLLGAKTYGKGSVQVPLALSEEEGFKITISKYYLPSDVNIDKVGILPDFEVNFPELSEEEKKSLESLMDSHKIYDYVDANPNINETIIFNEAKKIAQEYKLEERLVRKLFRNEVDKFNGVRLYDLDFDLQLNAAIEKVQSKNFWDDLKNAKTVKEQIESSNREAE